jgi:hypothetical protein
MDRPVAWDDLEATLGSLIEDAGIDRTKPVPFVIEGGFSKLAMHVINGRCPFNPGVEAPGAGEPIRRAFNEVTGRLIGFYTEGPPGELTHHGSRIHAHALIGNPRPTTGHVDRADFGQGVTILLPAR